MSCDACATLIGQPSFVHPHDRLQTEARHRVPSISSYFRCGECGNVLLRFEPHHLSSEQLQNWRLVVPGSGIPLGPECTANFHHYRAKPQRYTFYLRLWHWHDNHPLPPRLNKAARELLYYGRRLKQKIVTPRPRHGEDEYGDHVVARDRYSTPVRLFNPVPLETIEKRFAQIHRANEHLYNGDGSWDPHPLMPLYGSGIPLEEVSDRILGYLGAFKAFGDPEFLQRAEEAGRYLLERRLFATGHLRLEAHLVIELEYAYAGCALLALWEHDRAQSEYLRAAVKIGDRLVEEHIGGAIDHALKVAQLLAPLYRITGNETYLNAALRRAMRAVALQLPYGGWPGQDSRIWYHCIIARSLIDVYVATPNTLAYYTKKDRLARTITAALNRLLLSQSEGGEVKIGRGNRNTDPVFAYQEQLLLRTTVAFTGKQFVPATLSLHDFVPRDVIDFLTAAFDELAVQPAAIAAHGAASVLMDTSAVHRLEFETYMVGRYAQFLKRITQLNSETVNRLAGPLYVNGESYVVRERNTAVSAA